METKREFFVPELRRKLDPPAKHPGRRPYKLPETMSDHARNYLWRHDGHWLKWELDEEYNVYWGGTNRAVMAIDHETKIDFYLSPNYAPGQDDVEIISSAEGNLPEMQAYFGVAARLQPGGPGEPMNVVYMVDRDGSDMVCHACKTCGRVERYESRADECCRCRECGQVRDEAARRKNQHSSYCTVCSVIIDRRDRERRSRERAEALAKRPRVHWKDVDGPVNDDDDHFESDITEFAQQYLDNLFPVEEFTLQPLACTCRVEKLQLDADDVLTCALENGEAHDGAEWTDSAAFHAFVEEWNKGQTCETWWGNNDIIDWTGYPWLDHLTDGDEELRAVIESRLAELSQGEVVDA